MAGIFDFIRDSFLTTAAEAFWIWVFGMIASGIAARWARHKRIVGPIVWGIFGATVGIGLVTTISLLYLGSPRVLIAVGMLGAIILLTTIQSRRSRRERARLDVYKKGYLDHQLEMPRLLAEVLIVMNRLTKRVEASNTFTESINSKMGDGPGQINMFRAAHLIAKRYRHDADKIGEYASDLEARTERFLAAAESELRFHEQREDRDQILTYRNSSLGMRTAMSGARATALGLSKTLEDMWEFSQELTASKTELSASMTRIGKLYETIIEFADGIETRTARWLTP